MMAYAAVCKKARRVSSRANEAGKRHQSKELVANDIAGLGKKKQSVTP